MSNFPFMKWIDSSIFLNIEINWAALLTCSTRIPLVISSNPVSVKSTFKVVLEGF